LEPSTSIEATRPAVQCLHHTSLVNRSGSINNLRGGNEMSRLRAPIAIVGIALGVLPACGLDHRVVSLEDGGADTNVVPGPLGASRSWTGYIEQYTFASGSDAIKLTFSTDDHGNAVGTIVFGQGVPPAPATDPNVGYPLAFLPAAQTMSIDGVYVSEGFDYTFDAGKLDGQRLQLTANLAQLWSGWCALQVSPGPGFGPCFTTSSGRLGATELAGLQTCSVTNYDPAQDLQVDCGKLLLCTDERVCSCTTASCDVNRVDAVFDLFLTGKTMSGSVKTPFRTGPVHNVHFVES